LPHSTDGLKNRLQILEGFFNISAFDVSGVVSETASFAYLSVLVVYQKLGFLFFGKLFAVFFGLFLCAENL